MDSSIEICPICGRELGNASSISKHHLIPKSKGGKHTETITLHNICHRKIHSLFTEKELKMSYYTIEQLIAHEEMIKFVKWVAKKDIDFYTRTKQAKRK